METLLITNSWKVIGPACDMRVSGTAGLTQLCDRHNYKHFASIVSSYYSNESHNQCIPATQTFLSHS